MTPPLLELRAIDHAFPVRSAPFRPRRWLRALRGVSLQLRPGEVLGLVGESGCGKSTLARILLGLLRPDEGQILLDGEPLGTLSRRRLARRVQPVFQDPYASLNPRRSVHAIVDQPLRVHGLGDLASRRQRVAAALERVGLPQRLFHSYPHQLSGGQRQRVAIARALVMEPELLILDEPTSALDVSVQAQILNLLLGLRRELGLSYLFISHDLAVVEHLADRVAVMYLGEVVEEAPTVELFREPRHPYTRALLASVLTPEPGLGVPDTQLGAAFPDPLNPPSGCAFHPRCPAVMAHCRAEAPTARAAGGSVVRCHLY